MPFRICSFFLSFLLLSSFLSFAKVAPAFSDSVLARSRINKVDLQQQKEYITGPRGGCYYINRNGNKTYVDNSFCNATAAPTPVLRNQGSYSSPAAGTRKYIKGPRGGCYYLTESGKKVYVSRDICN